jgi:hypothetical protein
LRSRRSRKEEWCIHFSVTYLAVVDSSTPHLLVEACLPAKILVGLTAFSFYMYCMMEHTRHVYHCPRPAASTTTSGAHRFIWRHLVLLIACVSRVRLMWVMRVPWLRGVHYGGCTALRVCTCRPHLCQETLVRNCDIRTQLAHIDSLSNPHAIASGARRSHN